MTENSEPEPDVPTQLKNIGKKYLRFIEQQLDSVIEPPRVPRAKRVPQAMKPVAKPPIQNKPRTRNLGIRRWLKGPKEEERKDS